MRSWLLYIPAGLIEIHPHMKYQLAIINRSWDSTLDKNLNLVYVKLSMDGRTLYGHMHVWTTRTLRQHKKASLCTLIFWCFIPGNLCVLHLRLQRVQSTVLVFNTIWAAARQRVQRTILVFNTISAVAWQRVQRTVLVFNRISAAAQQNQCTVLVFNTIWAAARQRVQRTILVFNTISAVARQRVQRTVLVFNTISAAARQNQQNDLCTQQRLRSAWASTQSDQSSLSAWRKLGS